MHEDDAVARYKKLAEESYAQSRRYWLDHERLERQKKLLELYEMFKREPYVSMLDWNKMYREVLKLYGVTDASELGPHYPCGICGARTLSRMCSQCDEYLREVERGRTAS